MNYPIARKDGTKDLFFGTEVADPYRWMEEESEELKQWIKSQENITQDYLSAIPNRQQLASRLSELMDFDKYGMELRVVDNERIIYSVSEGLNNQPTYYVLNTKTNNHFTIISPEPGQRTPNSCGAVIFPGP